jgi:hypothetical protein
MAYGHHFPWSKALWKNFYFTELGIPIFTKNSEILYKKNKIFSRLRQGALAT